MKHTPGPWEVDDSGTLTGVNGAHIAAISNLDDFPCADADEMHPETREEVEAEYAGNARLIVAAPDLLAAAKAMLPFIRENRMEGETEYELAVLALEAAIRKATARS